MRIFPFSHDTLMLLNIILASVHILLSVCMLYIVVYKVNAPSYVFYGFLGISIIACILILLYSIDCKNIDMNQ